MNKIASNSFIYSFIDSNKYNKIFLPLVVNSKKTTNNRNKYRTIFVITTSTFTNIIFEIIKLIKTSVATIGIEPIPIEPNSIVLPLYYIAIKLIT